MMMDPDKRIQFRRASASRSVQTLPEATRCVGVLSGREARKFYEEVLSKPVATSQRSDNKVKRAVGAKGRVCLPLRSHDPKKRHNGKDFFNVLLLHAQEGNLKELKELFKDRSNNIDVNAADRFRWTALMCAACAGHSNVVRYLLEIGADSKLVNDRGQTACDLANEKCFSRIVQILKAHDTMDDVSQDAEGSSDDMSRNLDGRGGSLKREEFYCAACARNFTDTTMAQHETSTVHLFNTQPKQRNTWYHLTESNKGYQMLLQEGWDQDRGLGPEGKEGIKFPVKTVLKRDRKCLGSAGGPDSRPRVTHFKPFDLEAVKRPRVEKKRKEEGRGPKVSKRQLERKKRKEQQWEVDFRRSFSM